MNNHQQKRAGRFGPEPRFEVPPVAPAAFRAAQDTQLEGLKNRLLRQALDDLTLPQANAFVRRAANEAAAVAWDTHFPLLVFPGLFEEKTAAVRLQVERQASVRRRSRELLAV